MQGNIRYHAGHMSCGDAMVDTEATKSMSTGDKQQNTEQAAVSTMMHCTAYEACLNSSPADAE
jgi:hypothetical protein